MKERVFQELPDEIKGKTTVVTNENGIVNVEIKENETMKDIICYCFENKIEGATELLESTSMENR